MTSSELTQLLRAWTEGDQRAFERLIALVYENLRRMARHRLANERAGHTLQPTALVNEVYLRIVGETKINWQNRAHFFGACARTMRRILVDHARKRKARKRGGGATLLTLAGVDERHIGKKDRTVDLIALDEALTQLEAMDPRQSRIVELKFFAGLSIQETAEELDVSASTVKQEWTKARAWLFHELESAPRRERETDRQTKP